MKKLFTIFLFLICSNIIAGAQDKNAEAMVYYTNAEEAYNKGTLLGNDECIAQLKNAEKILGSTNPKILYLKIKAMWFEGKLLLDGYYANDIDISLRQFFSMANSETYPQDKYAEIIKVNSAFKKNNDYFKSKGYITAEYKISKDALLQRASEASRLANNNIYCTFQNYSSRLDAENLKNIEAVESDEYFKYAFSIYSFLANKGDTIAIVTVGDMYLYGKGVKQSPYMASKFYEKAAEKASKGGMLGLGKIYACEWASNTGSIYPAKPLEAIEWYKKAASIGSRVALYELGDIYLNSRLNQQIEGKSKDKCAKAIEYYTASANMGYKLAMEALARCYEFGAGGCHKDKRLALEWEKKASATKISYSDN